MGYITLYKNGKSASCFSGRETITQITFVGYEVIPQPPRHCSLPIYHLTSNAHPWNNCQIFSPRGYLKLAVFYDRALLYFQFCLQTRTERDKLTCFYNRNPPTQLLKPVKVEMLNLDPDLYLFHDIITDSEIEHVKKLAKPQVSVFNSTHLLPANDSVMILSLETGRLFFQWAWGPLVTGGVRLYLKKVELQRGVLIRKEI